MSGVFKNEPEYLDVCLVAVLETRNVIDMSLVEVQKSLSGLYMSRIAGEASKN